jgi:hypothetical protein
MPRRFDCPICGTSCVAIEKRAGETDLKHPLPTCKGLTPSLLLNAYVITCNPERKFPSFEDAAREVFRKGIE